MLPMPFEELTEIWVPMAQYQPYIISAQAKVANRNHRCRFLQLDYSKDYVYVILQKKDNKKSSFNQLHQLLLDSMQYVKPGHY